MAHPSLRKSSTFPSRDFFTLLRKYKWRWALPAAVIAILASLFAFQMSETWEVWQAVIVRNNAIAKDAEPGEFRGIDPMRRTEDTIVEVCRSTRVLAEALRHVGPPEDAAPVVATGSWPGEADVARLRENMSIEAPNGAEFGTTEVFYIKVKETPRKRAEELVTAIFENLRNRMGELRDQRARGLVLEIEKSVALAQTDLDAMTERLRQMEQSVGGDLIELRMLHQSPNGQGDLMQSLVRTERDEVELRAKKEVGKELLHLLKSAEENPEMLESAPPDLIASQPTLVALKDALVQAELRTAVLRRNLTDAYPTVKAALSEERTIRKRLRDELESVRNVLSADTKLVASRLRVLEDQRLQQHARLEKLAKVRADYTNLVNVVDHRHAELQMAERRLSEVRARQAVAQSASVITQLDDPGCSPRPVGPSRATVVLVGILGGLMSGFGLVFLTVQEPSPTRPSAADSAPVSVFPPTPHARRRSQSVEEEQPFALAELPR